MVIFNIILNIKLLYHINFYIFIFFQKFFFYFIAKKERKFLTTGIFEIILTKKDIEILLSKLHKFFMKF